MYEIKKILKKILFRILQSPETVADSRINGVSRGVQNLSLEGRNLIPDGCNFSGKIKIGYASTLGYNNVFHGDIIIGKYCQIGFDVAMHSTNHPSKYMTTYINNNLFNGELKSLKETKNIRIGNDVWIGHNAMIIGGVEVGNGVIIAAGSVVTKNIPPYSIVAGVPAKVIKMRFNENIIHELETLKWWDKDKEELEKLKPLFFKDLSQLNSIYEEEK